MLMVIGMTAAMAEERSTFEIVSKGFQSMNTGRPSQGSGPREAKAEEAGCEMITVNFVGPASESEYAAAAGTAEGCH